MYKRLTSLCGLALMVSLLFACGSGDKSQIEQKEKPQLVGNDKDDHGCIGSAGYQWSEVLQDCIRPFEKGVKLVSSTDPYTSFAAFLVFNADSSKVEVFLPKVEKKPILKRQADGTWGEKGAGKLSVSCEKGVWKLFLDEAAQYASE